MTESLSSLCRTLTSEGGYQLRDPYRRVEYIGRIGQGRAGQGTGHRARRHTRDTGQIRVKKKEEDEDEDEE